MNENNFCTRCGAPLPPNAQNCVYCGYPVLKPNYTPYKVAIVILCILNFILLVQCMATPAVEVPDDSIAENSTIDNETIINEENTPKETVQYSIGDLDEQEIYNDRDVKIVAKGIKVEGSDVKIAVYIENNTKMSLSFDARAYSVNGIMGSGSIYDSTDLKVDVAAGNKANTNLVIDGDFLSISGIKKIRDVDILFWTYDDYIKSFDTGVVNIKTSLSNNKSDKITAANIFDKNNIKVDYLKSEGNSYYYVVSNTTNDYISLDITDINVNGFTISEGIYDIDDIIVFNKASAIVKLEFNDEFISMNDITSIEQIDFKLKIRPNENYDKEYKTDVITHKVK